MNNQIVLKMVEPYVKDGSITYSQFEKIYEMLSLKEKYEVIDILYNNGIDIVDEDEQKGIDDIVLDTTGDALSYDDSSENKDEEEFEILYDLGLFRDKGFESKSNEVVFLNKEVKQSNEVLCALIQEGNAQAVQDLCVKNKRLVDKYALAYAKTYRHHLEIEDLEQAGFIGLIKGAQRYNPSLGNAFSTYVVWWIKQSISREIMDNGFVIRIPVHMMERINKVASVDSKYAGFSIKERIEKTAEELRVPEEYVRECLRLKEQVLTYTSLNAPVGEEEGSELQEFLAKEDEPSVEDIVERKELRSELERILRTLSEREQTVLRLRFGFDDGVPRTLEYVGEQFGVTRERIRQIENKALRKLRHPSRAKIIKEFYE